MKFHSFRKGLLAVTCFWVIVVWLMPGAFDAGQLAQSNALSAKTAFEIEAEAARLGKTWSEESVRQSSDLFQKAARAWEAQNNFSNSAKCLREAARQKNILADAVTATALLEKALAQERNGQNPDGEAETLSYLVIAASKVGDNQKGQSYLAKALSLTDQARQPQTLARVYFAAGNYLYNERNFQSMLGEYEKALPLFQKAGDKTGEAETLIELAYSHIINNDRLRGREAAQKAVEIARAIDDRRHLAFALIVLGDAYQRMGEWEPALKSFVEAESLFPEKLDYFEKAILNNRLAFYHLAYNDLNQAKNYFRKSYELFDRIGNSEGRSELLTELGQIAVREGNFEEAMSYFNRSKEIAVKANDPITLGVLELKIGETHFGRGNLEAAEKSFLTALRHYEKIGINYRIAEAHEKLGLIYEQQKDFVKARDKYRLALQLNQKVLSKFAQAQNYFNLARLDFSENRHDAALENIKESIKLTEASQSETANSNLKRSFIANVFVRYELYINLLMKMHRQNPRGNYAVEALQAAEKSRARVMLENLSLSKVNFFRDADAATVERENEIRNRLNAKADELTDLLSRTAAPAEADRISREISGLENELEEIKARLKQNSPFYSAIKNPPVFDPFEFQQTVLDEKTMLLEFSLGNQESYLWAVGKNEFEAFVLPPRAEIERRVEKLRTLLRDREMKDGETIETYQKRLKTADEDFRLEAALLSRDLFGQIADRINGKRLLVVPDGKLYYFPLAALPLPLAENNDPFLLTNEIVYEPSAQTLALLTNNRNREPQPEKNLLVFSDPIFNVDDARLTAGNVDRINRTKETFRYAESLDSLPRLPASKAETDSILAIVGTSKADVFSGFAANRERLLKLAAHNYKIIHFATHGLVKEDRPELSGIVLSRFNESAQKMDESFRIHDIYSLNLNADLVVLSACETGIGKEVKGEGLLSLNNAFLQVGAKSVVSSLWKVEDEATLELMKNFYAAMKEENLTPSQALRAAQIKLRGNPRYQSPFYWAAFTVQGDFRHQPDLTSDAGNWFYWLLLFPAGIFCFYLFRKMNRKSSPNA